MCYWKGVKEDVRSVRNCSCSIRSSSFNWGINSNIGLYVLLWGIIKIENNWIIYNIMLSLDRGVKMEDCIKDFLLENWDYGFAIMGLGEEVYLDGEETATFLQNENVEIDLWLDDILYILVGGIPCSVEPNWKWGRNFP